MCKRRRNWWASQGIKSTGKEVVIAQTLSHHSLPYENPSHQELWVLRCFCLSQCGYENVESMWESLLCKAFSDQSVWTPALSCFLSDWGSPPCYTRVTIAFKLLTESWQLFYCIRVFTFPWYRLPEFGIWCSLKSKNRENQVWRLNCIQSVLAANLAAEPSLICYCVLYIIKSNNSHTI